MPLFRHLSPEQLHAFTAGALPAAQHQRLAAHLRRCVRCQNALRFARRLEQAVAKLPAPAAPPGLLDRVLTARAAGERTILAGAALTPPPGARGGNWRVAGAGLLVAAAMVLAVVLRTPDLTATDGTSELRVVPALPKPGERLSVTYRPAPGLFPAAGELVLRARLRTSEDQMYAGAVPSRQIRAVASLRRAADGSYQGSFTLPDEVVFASLAVEDAAAGQVDTNDDRLWEVLVHGPDQRPLFESLNQRANDMMGRSWEEGYASARRMTELYPDQFASWALREFFEKALFSDGGADSIVALYAPRLDALTSAARRQANLSTEDIGGLFFRAASVVRAAGATAADSAAARYWWDRIRREHPRHAQVAQHLAVSASEGLRAEPRRLLDSLERLYPALAPLNGPGFNLVTVARQVATLLKDDAAIRRWNERGLAGRADSTLRAAHQLAGLGSFRAEGMTALRGYLSAPPTTLISGRLLTEDSKGHHRRVEAARRRIYAGIGRGLLAEGNHRGALDTLGLAAQGVWDPALFQEVAAAYLAANDTARAVEVRARLAVDPRTPAATAQRFAAEGTARLGAAGWEQAMSTARREMHAMLLDRAVLDRVRGTPRVMTASGTVGTLSAATGRQPSVVIFWSRYCGYALEALPRIIEVGERLRRTGTPVMLIVAEGPSADLTRFFADRSMTLPVYHDVDGTATAGFANFGTPTYYVLDAEGRIRFNQVDGEAELLAQVAALGGPSEVLSAR